MHGVAAQWPSKWIDWRHGEKFKQNVRDLPVFLVEPTPYSGALSSERFLQEYHGFLQVKKGAKHNCLDGGHRAGSEEKMESAVHSELNRVFWF